MSELILFSTLNYRRTIAGSKLCPFRNYNNAEVPTARMSHANLGRNFIHVEGLFGNQNHVGAPSDAAVNGNPTGVASHHFDHHHAIVGLGGSVDAIDSFGHDVHRSEERRVG